MNETKHWTITKRAFAWVYGRFMLRCYADALEIIDSEGVKDVKANAARVPDPRLPSTGLETDVSIYFDAWAVPETELFDNGKTPTGLSLSELDRLSAAAEEFRRLEEKSLEDEIYLLEEATAFLQKKAERYIEKALRFLQPAGHFKAWQTHKMFERVVWRNMAAAVFECEGAALPKPRRPRGPRPLLTRIRPGWNERDVLGSSVDMPSTTAEKTWGGGLKFRRSWQAAYHWPRGRPPLPREEYLKRRLASYLKRRKGTGKPRGLHVDQWKVPEPVKLKPRPTGNQYAKRDAYPKRTA